jgi:hypothetical protein
MDSGLAALVAGVDELLLGDALCFAAAGPFTLARGSRFGGLSDEAGPQLASPARSTRLRNITRYERDRCISSDRSRGMVMGDEERSTPGCRCFDAVSEAESRWTSSQDEQLRNARLVVKLCIQSKRRALEVIRRTMWDSIEDSSRMDAGKAFLGSKRRCTLRFTIRTVNRNAFNKASLTVH